MYPFSQPSLLIKMTCPSHKMPAFWLGDRGRPGQHMGPKCLGDELLGRAERGVYAGMGGILH